MFNFDRQFYGMPGKFLKDLPVIFLNNSSFTNCSARSSTSLFRVQPGTVCLLSLDWVSCSFCLCDVLYVSVTFPQKDFNSSLTLCILAPCVVAVWNGNAECPPCLYNLLLLTNLFISSLYIYPNLYFLTNVQLPDSDNILSFHKKFSWYRE